MQPVEKISHSSGKWYKTITFLIWKFESIELFLPGTRNISAFTWVALVPDSQFTGFALVMLLLWHLQDDACSLQVCTECHCTGPRAQAGPREATEINDHGYCTHPCTQLWERASSSTQQCCTPDREQVWLPREFMKPSYCTRDWLWNFMESLLTLNVTVLWCIPGMLTWQFL